MYGAQKIRNTGEKKSVFRVLRIISTHLPVCSERFFVIALRQTEVAHVEEAKPKRPTVIVYRLGQLDSLAKMLEATIEFGPPLENPAQSDTGCRKKSRIPDYLRQANRLLCVFHHFMDWTFPTSHREDSARET